VVARAPEELHSLVEAAFNSGDVDTLVDLYDDDATLIVPPEGARATGKHAIRMAVEATLALKPVARMEVLEKLESDGLALTQGRWTLVGAAEDGARVELSGRGTMVSRCQPDGSWRIVLDNPMSFDSPGGSTAG
jgi:ketosteroid isomerase-like protein